MSTLYALLRALVFALCVSEAGAHASLVSVDPSDGAILAAAPDQILLRFDEPVAPISLKLLDGNGAEIALAAAPSSQGETIRLPMPARLRRGTYVLSYRVTSADSHPVAGSLIFSIGQATSHPDVAGTAMTDHTAWRIAVRALRDIALLTAAGSALFLLSIAHFPRERLILGAAAAAAVFFSMAGIGLQGVALIGHGNVLGSDAWRVALRSSYGLSALVAIAAGLAMVIAAAAARGRARCGLLALGGLAAVAALPLTGHAASEHPRALAMAAVGTHALAAAFWTGSLLALHAMLRQQGGEIGQALRRFSRIATVAVPLLLVAGAGFAAMQLQSPSALVDTRYGNLVLAKALLFAVLLGIAACNRFRLLASIERDTPGAPIKLRRSIAAEIAIIVVVLGLTAVLTQTPPRERPTVSVLRAGSYTALLSIERSRPGRNAIGVQFLGPDGRPYHPPEATLEITNPAAGVEPITRPLRRTEQGDYLYEGGELAFKGQWTVDVRMRIDDFERIAFRGSIEVR